MSARRSELSEAHRSHTMRIQEFPRFSDSLSPPSPSERDAIFYMAFQKQSPGHHSSTAFSLGPLVSEIGSDHILHGDTHGLIYGDLNIAKAACLPTKSHRAQRCSHGGI